MRLSHLFSGIAVSCAVFTSVPALAASDYLLQLEGVKGDAATGSGPATIEVLSWSWGASNPTSVGSGGLSAGKVSVQDLSVTRAPAAKGGGGGAGKVNVQDLSATSSSVVTAREAGSGMATGRSVATGDGAPGVVAAAPAAGSVSELTVRFRESPTRASTGRTACAAGKHFDKVTLRGADGTVTLQDATVTACGGQGDDRTMTVKGKTGHVTLIK